MTRKLKGHSKSVNSFDLGRRSSDLVVSGSDDCRVKVWDQRSKQAVLTFEFNYQITAVCFNHTTTEVFVGGVDNAIHLLDLKTHLVSESLYGHKDTITGICLSKSGSFLLSNALDQTLRAWDTRPFVQNQNRELGVFEGARHNFEKNLLRCAWSRDDKLVSCGSSDGVAYLWDFETHKLKHQLGGHKGSLNALDFHPTSNILATCSSDKSVCVGEL